MIANVEIITISTGDIRQVLRSPLHLEAPNWSPDGTHLIVNADGVIYRLDLATSALTQIDTGPHDRCNNDHGLSPDGQTLAFCDKALTGRACIYVMPAAGGAARRVTDNLPSWFHGWSPDGRRLVYPAVRDEVFGIYSISAQGGPETCLIQGPGHYDGPDHTPDGQYIWFNAERGQTMSLWRMRADGSAPERMTRGDRVEWFPHPSPDGRHVCYLSYPPGTQGHPFGCDVELRLMPACGGAPRVLTQLYGGQGTINVPSWSPDSSQFAYVRYCRD